MNIQNLQKRCIELVALDPAFKFFWTKWIVAVDRSKENGFAFTGDFFEDDTIELEPAYRLIILAASTGQSGYKIHRDYRRIYEHHEVLLLLPTGELERTGLVTENDKRWAVAIRDQVALLLGKINQVHGEGTAMQVATDHLIGRMMAVRLGQTAVWDAMDTKMLQVVFDELERAPRLNNAHRFLC